MFTYLFIFWISVFLFGFGSRLDSNSMVIHENTYDSKENYLQNRVGSHYFVTTQSIPYTRYLTN